MRILIFLAALAAASAANAQDYSVDITLGSASFIGSLVYADGQITDVNVSDGMTGGTFTVGTGSGESVSLTDYEGLTPHLGDSEFFSLSFDTSAPLGAQSMTVSDVLFNYNDGHAFGITECGSGYVLGGPTMTSCGGSMTDPPSKVTSAPEFNPSTGLVAATLLGGLMLVLKGSRRAHA